MIFSKEDYMWIFALGVAMVFSALGNVNALMFVGIILISRGLLGLIIYIIGIEATLSKSKGFKVKK